MLNDRIAALIARKLSGEATPDELKELSAHFQIYPADQYFEELLSSYWNSQHDTLEEQNLYSDEHFEHILELASKEMRENVSEIEINQTAPGPKKNKILMRLGMAAVIVGILFGSSKLIPRKVAVPKLESENEVMAKKGARSKLLLPDGSQVWLNSDSRLVYSNSFNDTIREVELEGEAYFDVVKDPGRPFIVHTSSIDIRVLGTSFDVKSYPGESTIEATLIRGLIEVTKKDQPLAPKIILRPHEKLVLDKIGMKKPDPNGNKETPGLINTKSPIAITTVPKNLPDTSIIETSWIYNKLLFEGDSFKELAKKMERWFNVKINFKNEKAANYRFRGSFTNETIEQALQELQIIFPFSYKINGNEVDIDKK